MESELKRVKNGRLYLIPASEETRGHSTIGVPKFWKQQVQEFLQTVPRRTMLRSGPLSAGDIIRVGSDRDQKASVAAQSEIVAIGEHIVAYLRRE
jgi:hypothetical protein